ncbi:hypothetical protein [Apibacter mensalis]|nr:hypothetical protein [Apibacter mensalis]
MVVIFRFSSSYEKLEDSRGAMDFWICKLDSKGHIEWQKTLGGADTIF